MLKLLAIYISLLTCTPGKDVYAYYGHTALRVIDTEEKIDWCYNYGTFSFESDNFYWKFVKGETYYCLDVCTTEQFVASYHYAHRKVYEQRLNLSQDKAREIKEALIENSKPENSEYLYNFVYDNCATRPYNLIKSILGESITSTYHGWEGLTYREFIHYYTHPNSVIDALIQMIFGSRADEPMRGEARLFLPEELMWYLENATYKNGAKVVEKSNIGHFVIEKPRWWESVWLYLVMFTLLMTCLSIYDRRRGKLTFAVDIVLGVVYIILLAIVIFLNYFSIHPLVGWNWRLLVVPAIHLCTRLIYILR